MEEKTYKIVPFDIELAKKIQSGEVEGRIVTEYGGWGGKAFEYIELPEEAPEYEFKPFDKVLVRHSVNGAEAKWEPQLFSMVTNDPFHKNRILYKTIDGCYYDKCIPYKGNEHLVGTTNKNKNSYGTL